MQCYYKYFASYEAQVQIDCSRTAKTAVDRRTTFCWLYMYTYLFDHVCIKISILHEIVSNDLITTIATRVAIDIRLYDLRSNTFQRDR